MRHDDRVWIMTEYVFKCKICRAVNIVRAIPIEISSQDADLIREHNEQDEGEIGTVSPQEIDRLPYVVRCSQCKQIYAVQNYHHPEE